MYGLHDGEECRNNNKERLTFNSLLYMFRLGNLWVERGCIVVFYSVDKA